jgi:hypothetical protein
MYKEEVGELVVMMEGGTTKGGGRRVELSRLSLAIIGGVFLVCLVGVGVVTWRLSSCRGMGDGGVAGGMGPRFKARLLDVRLPRSVVPESYKLRLIPFLEEGNFTFSGEVVIQVNVSRATSNITLHSNELEILRTEVARLGSTVVADAASQLPVQISDSKFDPDREFFIVFFHQPLEPGRYKIAITYRGILNDALQGFYRSSYTFGNTTRYVLRLHLTQNSILI